MAQRITAVGVLVEYKPPDVRRITAVGVLVEHSQPVTHKYGIIAKVGKR